MLIINCKNYTEVAGTGAGRLVAAAEKASKKHKVEIAVAPPQHLLSEVAGSKVTILAQHVDDAKAGSTTGYMVPELLKESGVKGAIINHSEHRVPAGQIGGTVSALRGLGMYSVVCAKNASEAGRLAALRPDYIAVEPPELIGTGRAISTENPALITRTLGAIGGAKNPPKLLCGAGIVTGDDARRAVELGACGVLVASGIVRAKNWERAISDMAESIAGAA